MEGKGQLHPLTALSLVKTSRYPKDEEQGGPNSQYWPWWEYENSAVAEKEFSYPRSPDSGVVTMATELLWFLRSLCRTS